MCGVNISEAIRAHQDYLEPSKVISGKKKNTFATSTLNPKAKIVICWYDQWRQKNLGPREGKSACEVGKITVLSEK